MAVLFRQKNNGVEYAVHSAGATRRLYTDGIFHSQYNPSQILTGSIWDLLLLPSFFFPASSVKRVLVLGLGGGALVHQLKYFYPQVEIVAVDIDAMHIHIAKKYFAVDYPDVELIHADAIAWLKAYKGPPFDLVVDDLFWADEEGLASRVIPVDSDWWVQLQSRVTEQGGLIINFANRAELQQSCFYRNREFSSFLKGRYALQTADCENQVVCLSASPLKLMEFRARLAEQPLLDKRKASCKLNYGLRPLPAS